MSANLASPNSGPTTAITQNLAQASSSQDPRDRAIAGPSSRLTHPYPPPRADLGQHVGRETKPPEPPRLGASGRLSLSNFENETDNRPLIPIMDGISGRWTGTARRRLVRRGLDHYRAAR